MAGNFLKYGAAEATFGAKTPNDMPVDAHQLIALCAPRPTFISYGVPEKGDAQLAGSAGQLHGRGRGAAGVPSARRQGSRPLRRLPDGKDAGGERSMLGGELAWRQHDGGHTDQPNWKHFIPWADKQLGRTPAAAAPSSP